MDDYLEFRSKYGPVDCLDTRTFFLGPKIAAETEVSITNWWMIESSVWDSSGYLSIASETEVSILSVTDGW